MKKVKVVRVEILVDTCLEEGGSRRDDYGSLAILASWQDAQGVNFSRVDCGSTDWMSLDFQAGREPLLDNLLDYLKVFGEDQKVRLVRVLVDELEVSRFRFKADGSIIGTWTGLMATGGELHLLTGRLPIKQFRAVMARRRRRNEASRLGGRQVAVF